MMTGRLRLAARVAALISAAVLAWHFLRPPSQPAYAGRSLDDWFRQFYS
jgi:hypothetical protein